MGGVWQCNLLKRFSFVTSGTQRCLRQTLLARSIATGGGYTTGHACTSAEQHAFQDRCALPWYNTWPCEGSQHARDRHRYRSKRKPPARPLPPAALEGIMGDGCRYSSGNHGAVPGAFRGNMRVLQFENGAPDSLRVHALRTEIRARRTEITGGVAARIGTATGSGGGSHHRRCPRAQEFWGA